MRQGDWVTLVQDVHRLRNAGHSQEAISQNIGRSRKYIRLAGDVLGIVWKERDSLSTMPDEIPDVPAIVKVREQGETRFTSPPCRCNSGYCGPDPTIDGHDMFSEDLLCERCGIHLAAYREGRVTCDGWIRILESKDLILPAPPITN